MIIEFGFLVGGIVAGVGAGALISRTVISSQHRENAGLQKTNSRLNDCIVTIRNRVANAMDLPILGKTTEQVIDDVCESLVYHRKIQDAAVAVLNGREKFLTMGTMQWQVVRGKAVKRAVVSSNSSLRAHYDKKDKSILKSSTGSVRAKVKHGK